MSRWTMLGLVACSGCGGAAKPLVVTTTPATTTSGTATTSTATTSEAQLSLDLIRKATKAQWSESAGFFEGSEGLTPATPCCDGPGHKCEVNGDQWDASPVWAALDFKIDQPSSYQYSYQATHDHLVATAVGDRFCGGITETWTLEGKIDAEGGPVFTLTKPKILDFGDADELGLAGAELTAPARSLLSG